VGEVPIYNKI